jgi:orotate phosphoribosyltransferase
MQLPVTRMRLQERTSPRLEIDTSRRCSLALTAPPLDTTILAHLMSEGLLREGHFQYRSGRHSAALLDRDRLLADPQAASRMGYALAKAFFTNKIETVAAPSVWGAGLAQWVAYFIEPRAKVVYATPMPDGSRRVAECLHDLIAGKRILLIDNVMLSGETMARFDAEIFELGGEVIGVGCLWAGADSVSHAREVFGLLNERYPAYAPEQCPLCQEGNHEIEIVPY